MPQIPTLPIDEPVALPKAKPQQFGSVGETIAGLGEETTQLAYAASEVESGLIRAQRQLKAKQAEISFDQRKLQVYDDLRKAVTPEEAQQIYEHSKGELDSVLTPFQHDHVLARELGIYRQQEDVEIRGTVNAKKADIITKADHAANEVLGQKALQNAINIKLGGGDPSTAREQFNLQLQSSVTHGTMIPEQATAVMQKWDKEYQTGVLDAYANSPNPLVRRQLIDQLKGGKGPADISGLDQSEINQFLTHAEEADRKLTQLAEVQNHNADINTLEEAAHAAPFVGPDGERNYPAMRAAVQDGKWLVEHGMYATDPNTGKVIPDYVRGEKLLEHINAGEATTYQAAKEVADKERDEIFDLFSKGNIRGGLNLANKYRGDFEKAKVDYYPSIVAQTRAWTEFQIMEARAARGELREKAMQERQDTTDRGFDTMDKLQQRFMNGETLDYGRDIFPHVINKDMNPQQAHEVWGAIEKSEKDPDFNAGMAVIYKSSLNAAEKAKQQAAYATQFRKENLSGDKAIDRAQKLVDSAGKTATGGFIQRLWNNLSHGPLGAAAVPAPKDYGEASGKPEGTTGTLPDGTKVVVRKGRVVAQ